MADSTFSRRNLPKVSIPSWFTPAMATDWLVSFLLLLLDREVLERATPFQQPLKPFIDDPTLQYKHINDKDQHVPGELNTWLTLMLPLAIVLAISTLRKSFKEAHHAALALWGGYEFNSVATNFIKLLVGRLRPDFWDRCQYDAVKEICTGPANVVLEGRRSFPSGHSSSAFFGCVYLMLFLAGKNRCFAYSSVFPGSGILKSRLLRVVISLSPLFLSTYVAATRWEDHWHHPTDIMVGSILGTLIAFVTYHIWWPCPFYSSNFDTMAYPRKTHVELEELEQDGQDDEEESLIGGPRV